MAMESSESRISPSSGAAFDDVSLSREPRPATGRAGANPAIAFPPPDRPESELQSDALEPYVPVAADALGRERRSDGFTPDRQVAFLAALARCGVAADACRAVGISRDTAYRLRSSARGRAFALAWDAAILISRGRLGDELQSRALNGVVDKIYRNGELWGERHRHDNRLAMAVLTRLDRQAEGLGEGASTARAIAQEWDQFLDIVRDEGDGAELFLALRASRAEAPDGPGESAEAKDLRRSAESLDRLAAYEAYGGGLPGEGHEGDLDPEAMEHWSEAQWARAEHVGLLASLLPVEWPESARTEEIGDADGACPNRQDISAGAANDLPFDGRVPGLARVRHEYRRRFPPQADDATAIEDGEEFEIWEDDEVGWVTNFPPPADFHGTEYGDWFDDPDYFRSLTVEEEEANWARIGRMREAKALARSGELAAASAARDRAFGFADDPGEFGAAVEPAAESDISRAPDRPPERAE
jgi:hypothetical protein